MKHHSSTPDSSESADNGENNKYQSFTQSIKFFFGFCEGQKSRMLWAMWMHIADLVPFMLFPIVSMIIVDYFIPSGNIRGIVLAMIITGIMVGLNVFFHYVFRVALFSLLFDVSRNIRNTLVRRLQMLSLSYHNKRPTGRYFSKIMTDVEQMQNFSHMFINSSLSVLVSASAGVIILAMVNWKVLLICGSFIPLFQIVMFFYKNKMRRSRKEARKARESLSSTIGNFLQSSLLARMHGHENYESSKVDNSNLEMNRKTLQAEIDVSGFIAINGFCLNMFNFMVIGVCAVFVIYEEITIGELILFTNYINRVMQNVNTILEMFPQVVMFNESVNSVKEIIDAPDIEYNQGKRKVESISGQIDFKEVCFSYKNGGEKVLTDVSVEIKPGMSIGLVGKSGSGKSTFVNLLLGLYRTENGIVSIDGMPINSLDMRTVRHHIGVVSQSPVIFSGTIRENIVHAYKDISFDEVIEAARKANAHEFISRLQDGYETQVGENGVMLSGGQKQRIALARTILRNPSILILDEATSALDSESEKLVQQAIDNLDRQMTKIIIAHRLSTIRHTDMILVFKDGGIVERGSHEELLAQNGVYANLLMYQSLEPQQSLEEFKNTISIER